MTEFEDEHRAAEVVSADQGSPAGTTSGSENSDLELFSLAGETEKTDAETETEKSDAMPSKSKATSKKSASKTKGGKKITPSDKMKAAKKKAFALYQSL
jgi:hypothetical protein